MHRLLILSRFAREYHDLVDAARLPDLAITATADPAAASVSAASFDLAFGEPALLRQLMPSLTAVRWIQSTWAGVEPLLDSALRRDYTLTNARGVFGPEMSEYVFGYLLARERKIFEKRAAQMERRWDPEPPTRLRGKQLGLLGVGTIGAALAATAKHFGMRVKGYTRASEDSADVDEYCHGPLDTVGAAFAADLDYLVCVMPGTRATHHIVNAALLSRLPPRAVFVNPGRGGVVDEAALAAALQEGRLAGAVLDVFAQEPLPPDHVFWRLPNVLITSHTAALSAPADIAPIFVDNYRRLLRGEALRYRVDFEQGYDHMPHAIRDGVTIYWEEHGSGDPLLLIMGLGATLEWWNRLVPVLAARYRTIVFDNRGVGRSDIPPGPYPIAEMAEDAIAVMDAAGIDRAHVFGASMGGMIAQELALAHPSRVRSLILGCTACGGPQSVPAAKEVRDALGARSTMTREQAMWVMAPFIFDAGTPRQRVAEDIAVRLQAAVTNDGYFAQLGGIRAWKGTFDRLPSLTMPVLVIHGETDQLVPAENGRIIAKAIPGSRLAMIPHASHIFFTDQFEASRGALLEFLP